jgi:glutaminyl-peptide cyclotransferase
MFGKSGKKVSNVWKIAGLALLLPVLGGCGRAAPPPPLASSAAPILDATKFDGQRALDEARYFVELGLRDAGTPGALKAAQHLLARLTALGLDARIDEFVEASPRGDVAFRNVKARKSGKGAGLVVLASHYDTKTGLPEGFEGANDSASSCGALLELARVIADSPDLPFEVQFAFLDGEECMTRYGPNDGFHGSRRYAAELVDSGRAKEVRAFILLDMIGDKDLSVTIPRNSTSALVSQVFDAAREEGARSKFALFAHQIGDDHDAFLDAGMPAVDLIDFHYGSAPGLNDYWHTAEDTFDKISAESLQTIGRVVLRTLNRLSVIGYPVPDNE